ncbi:MAG: TetR/AcrR family transcriptional regulator [Pararhodobacter sp.]|nr:TetR/AcrR family transcriptional regulator [Pararhodobacter sp.]
MPRSPTETSARILDAASALIQSGGPSALTFDAIARRIGMSKQAVLYWFPNKITLISAIALPCLRAEAEAASAAARTAETPADARKRIVLALISFHLADLPRFRLMYVSQQVGGHTALAPEMLKRIHPVTDTMYTAITEALGNNPDDRAQAVALHMAALGHVLLMSLADAVGDPLKHKPETLAEVLASMLAGRD